VGLSVGVKVGVRIDAVGVVGLLKQAVKVRKILINKILVKIFITVISVISPAMMIRTMTRPSNDPIFGVKSLSRSEFRALRGSVTPERRSQAGADKIGLERNTLDLLSLVKDKFSFISRLEADTGR
jgi:hypothetical protein